MTLEEVIKPVFEKAEADAEKREAEAIAELQRWIVNPPKPDSVKFQNVYRLPPITK